MRKEKQSSKLNLLQLAYLGTPFSAVAASRCSERRVGLEEWTTYFTFDTDFSTNLNPAPVDQTSASAWLHILPRITCQNKNKSCTSMTHVAWESDLRSVVRSRTCSGIHGQKTGWESGVRSCIRPELPTISKAGIKCRHCTPKSFAMGAGEKNGGQGEFKVFISGFRRKISVSL